jgi:hypothetical protein
MEKCDIIMKIENVRTRDSPGLWIVIAMNQGVCGEILALKEAGISGKDVGIESPSMRLPEMNTDSMLLSFDHVKWGVYVI